ncbi:MAG: STAS/SEC14 domain-containing protein [bacterium]
MKKQGIEILAGKNRVYFGEDKILYADFVGELTVETLNLLYDFFNLNKSKMMVEGKVKILLDITSLGKPSMEARKLTYMLSLNKDIGKFAIIGLNPVARVIAAFFMGNSQKKDVKFFSTKESAIEWLKE